MAYIVTEKARPIMRERQSGFTLMEVLITVAIIGILSALATPSLMAWRQNSRFVGTLQSMAANLQRGKLMAIRENNDVGVEMNQTDYIVFLNLDADTSFTAGDQVIANEQLPPGYVMASVPAAAYPVSFLFNGRGTTDISNEIIMQITSNVGRIGFVRANMLGRIGHTFQ